MSNFEYQQNQKVKSGILDKISIKNKLVLLVIMVSVILVSVSSIVMYQKTGELLFKQKQDQVAFLTEAAATIAADNEAKVAQGIMTEEQAKTEALKTIASIRFDNGNYFFVTDYDGFIIAHGSNPKLVGTDFKLIQDKKTGIKFIPELLSQVKSKGDGIVTYFWTKPGQAENALFKKITVAKSFEKWGWMISAGVYMDDVEKTNAETLTIILVVDAVAVILIIILSYFTIGRSIINPIDKLSEISNKLANNELNVFIPDDDTNTEIGNLNRSFKKFVGNLEA